MTPVIYVDATPTLIILSDDGLEYEAQTGGIICAHPTVRGIPVFPSWLERFDSRRLEALSCQYGCFGNPFTEKAADAIEDAWPTLYGVWGIDLDRDRLDESMEAWIPVKVTLHQNEYIRSSFDDEFTRWIENKEGILILNNCD